MGSHCDKCFKLFWTADLDKDGFRVRFYGKSYKSYTVAKTWVKAQDTCKEDGGTLVITTSSEEEKVRFLNFSDKSIMFQV